ncbi:CLN3 protein-domain-containing protein [Diplogelasinospora grovesii]|uniref:CLN3 protein-domain-containing protein n=1 Tax=Diplogelasinospora grovesii TaxID=303347 RepID=A0AAN6MZV7_9PEZI|nr:CLN3 protein-domain-containing protein [Diplogelasinospora grovesii]
MCDPNVSLSRATLWAASTEYYTLILESSLVCDFQALTERLKTVCSQLNYLKIIKDQGETEQNWRHEAIFCADLSVLVKMLRENPEAGKGIWAFDWWCMDKCPRERSEVGEFTVLTNFQGQTLAAIFPSLEPLTSFHRYYLSLISLLNIPAANRIVNTFPNDVRSIATMNRSFSSSSSSSSSGLFQVPLPMPGSPSSSWAIYRARFASIFQGADSSVLIAFWLFGLINNVLYVIILSAAQDLVGTDVPKGVVLVADVLPSFATKLVAPYLIHRVPYAQRILGLVGLSTAGMLLVAVTPANKSVAVKLVGVVLASFASGLGELSFLGLTHYYGQMSLAAWGSGTGGAGLIGAGLYVLMTDWIGFSVRASLLASAGLPMVMLGSFFMVLPRGPLREGTRRRKEYEAVRGDSAEEQEEEEDQEVEEVEEGMVSSTTLLRQQPSNASATQQQRGGKHTGGKKEFAARVRQVRTLFFPYMLPLLLVYIAEYTINQGVAPTLLFPLRESPFTELRAFYPFYNFLYQLGVFISRSSTPFFRVHHLYIPSLLQIANLLLLTLHALFSFIPSVYLVFIVVFWEGLLGGAVYVNAFAEILESVPIEEREFSLGATSVSDSGGICIAGFIGMAMEVWLCDWQVQHGRDWCRRIKAS